MTDTDPGKNGAGDPYDGFEMLGGVEARQYLKRTREPPRGLRTPTERRSALEDTLGFAAQEADALATYYASVANQLRLLARQVTYPPQDRPDTPAADQYGEHGEPGPHTADR